MNKLTTGELDAIRARYDAIEMARKTDELSVKGSDHPLWITHVGTRRWVATRISADDIPVLLAHINALEKKLEALIADIEGQRFYHSAGDDD